MKRNILFLLSLCMLLLTCSDSNDPIKEVEKKDPFISLKKSNIDFTNEGGSEAILIESNVTWTAKSSASWCTVTPSSGNKSTESITLSASANKDYDNRSCSITIESGGITKTITVNQRGDLPGGYWVDKMGTLGTLLNQTQKDTITTMIIMGEINKADFDVMKLEMPKLKYIDMKDVKCKDDKIPNSAFGGNYFNNNYNKFINTIILPKSITAIGISAFSNCSGLTGNLILPDGVTTIGNSAFSSCTGFTGDLILPNGLTTIESSAFSVCTGFTGNLILPDGVITVGYKAFYGCSGFTGNLILPKGLSEIGEYAFGNCTGFTGDLVIPDGVKTIGSLAFQNCRGFTGDLIIHDGVKTIGESAFHGCSGFTGDLILPKGLSEIGVRAFFHCIGFTGDLVISDGLVIINNSAFQYCSGLTGLTIGKNVTTIEESAFNNCSNITGNVVFPASLTSTRKESFYGCNKVEAFQFPHTTPLGYYKDMLPSRATVKVPTSAVATYKAAYGWKDHTIVGY
ncbi:MAG TPA: leucine-rich repeat protein [Atopostipes sp.]|nr:leucine-rich repeat protein [Atopostipes sp.]